MNKRQGVNYENNSAFKEKTKYMFVASHMGMEEDHNINVGKEYLKMLQNLDVCKMPN
jgi:hypothetical protein